MDDTLRRALREHNGLRHQLDKNLLGDDGEKWRQEFTRFLRKEPCWVNQSVMLNIMTHFEVVKRMVVPASTLPYVARERLTATGQSGPNVKFRSPEFVEGFTSKIEPPANEPQFLLVLKTIRPMGGIELVNLLGGEAAVEMSLAGFDFFLCSRMSQLRANPYTFIDLRDEYGVVFLRDVSGQLKRVTIRGGGSFRDPYFEASSFSLDIGRHDRGLLVVIPDPIPRVV